MTSISRLAALQCLVQSWEDMFIRWSAMFWDYARWRDARWRRIIRLHSQCGSVCIPLSQNETPSRLHVSSLFIWYSYTYTLRSADCNDFDLSKLMQDCLQSQECQRVIKGCGSRRTHSNYWDLSQVKSTPISFDRREWGWDGIHGRGREQDV